MSSDPQREAFVIGAGIIGVCCAIYLQREGFRVVVLDAADPGEACSFGNSGSFGIGLVAPAGLPGVARRIPSLLLDPRQPLFVDWRHLPRLLPWLARFLRESRIDRVGRIARARHDLLARAMDAYAPLFEAAGLEPLIRRSGMLFVFEDARPRRSIDLSFEIARRHGVVIEELSGSEARAINPALGRNIERAAFFPANVHTVNPSRLVKAFASHFEHSGGTILREHVREIRVLPGRTPKVLTDAGMHDCPTLVVAAGIWSRSLLARFDVPLPIEAERGYHVMVPLPAGLTVPTTLSDRNIVLTPMEHGLRITGIAEFADAGRPANFELADSLLRQARECVSGLKEEPDARWMGPRPSTPDSLPVISRSAIHPSVYLAFGHGQSGLAMGAITGKLIGEMAAGREPTVDVEPFAIGRFRCGLRAGRPGRRLADAAREAR